jgi:hypothetical protein
MKTDDLIERLARGLEPVPRLPSANTRAARWSLCALLYVAALATAIVWLMGVGGAWGPAFWVPQLAAAATAALASAAAFASVVPGAPNRWRVWTVAAAFGWLVTLGAASPASLDWNAVTAARSEWWCVAVIVLGGAPLMIVLTSMLRRGAPLAPATTAAFAALAVIALANVAACVALPHTNGAVTFAWHGGVLLAGVVIAALCGRALFAWPKPNLTP